VSDRIFLGVLRAELRVPGARTLKDRRRGLHSVRDRIRHRFDVVVHEVDDVAQADRAVLAIVCAGSEQRLLHSVIDRITAFIAGSGSVVLGLTQREVFRWSPWGRIEAGSGFEADEVEDWNE
jgi:uncharacterized protein